MNCKAEGVKKLQILHISGTDRLSELGTNREGGPKTQQFCGHFMDGPLVKIHSWLYHDNIVEPHPEQDGEKKKKFAVCVKGLDFPSEDISVRLVEWIEMLNILGADKVGN